MTFKAPALFLLIFSFIAAEVHAQTLITISSKKGGKALTRISQKQFQSVYSHIKTISRTTTPSPKRFLEDYVRYLIGVETAYNDSSLVKSPNIRNMFASPLLKQGFDELLYKMLAETKLRKQISRLDKSARKLSKTVLLRFYKKNPDYNFQFIQISFPENPSAKQLKTTKARAEKIHKEVKKSKKTFPDLINIYSDDRISGQTNIPRNRNTTHPSIYKVIKTMKRNQISRPIRSFDGFYIIKLNRQVPFGEANRTQIKSAYFDQKRTEIFNKYFDGLKKQYTVQINQSVLKKIK